MLFQHVSIASVAHIDAPHSLTSAEINERLRPTLDRLGIRTDVLGDIAGIKARRLWDDDVQASDAATLAAEKALADAGVDRNRIGLLEEYVRYVRADLVERLQQQLLAAPDAPVYWAADVREVVETNARALLASDPPRLDEWPAGIDAAGCAERLRASCLELAAGYRHWPGLWQTAAELGEKLLPAR